MKEEKKFVKDEEFWLDVLLKYVEISKYEYVSHIHI